VKEKLATEDDEHRSNEEIQKMTDQYIAQIESLTKEKEQELLEV
jgi:ribosome recycling factor